MKMPWNRSRGNVVLPIESEAPEVPIRTEWKLTMCRKCHRVRWFGMPIPYAVTSEEDVEQLRRVNQGRGSSKRMKVMMPLRLVMGRPEEHQWRCKCGAGIEMCGVASTATNVLAVTQFKMRSE